MVGKIVEVAEIGLAQWTLSAIATAGGYVVPSSVAVNEGNIATITAYPYSGYEFDHWEREGLISFSNPYMAIMYRNISIAAYFRAVAIPPTPPPEEEYPTTDIKDVAINVVGVEYPVTDIKNVVINPIGPEYPVTDIKDVVISVIGVEYPVTDIRNVVISIVGLPIPPTPPTPPEEEEVAFPWLPVLLIGGGIALAVTSIKFKGG